MSVWAYDLPMPRDASDAKPFGGDSIAKCLSIPICALSAASSLIDKDNDNDNKQKNYASVFGTACHR